MNISLNKLFELSHQFKKIAQGEETDNRYWQEFYPEFIVIRHEIEKSDRSEDFDKEKLYLKSLKEIVDYVFSLLSQEEYDCIGLELQVKSRNKKIKKPHHKTALFFWKTNDPSNNDFNSPEELFLKTKSYFKDWFGNNFDENNVNKKIS